MIKHESNIHRPQRRIRTTFLGHQASICPNSSQGMRANCLRKMSLTCLELLYSATTLRLWLDAVEVFPTLPLPTDLSKQTFPTICYLLHGLHDAKFRGIHRSSHLPVHSSAGSVDVGACKVYQHQPTRCCRCCYHNLRRFFYHVYSSSGAPKTSIKLETQIGTAFHVRSW